MRAIEQPDWCPKRFLGTSDSLGPRRARPSVSDPVRLSGAGTDHGLKSDKDLALVYQSEVPVLEGLRSSLGGHDIDWVPIERSHAMRRSSPQVCMSLIS